MWRIYQPQLIRLLQAKGAGSVEDIASQVWIDIGRALPKFDGDGTDFRRWMFTIAHRRHVDGVRQKKRRRETSADSMIHEPVALGTDAAYGAAAGRERILGLLGQLAPTSAEAVMLRMVYDLSVEDAAEIMNRSEGAVRALVHRGLTRLRELLEEDGPNLELSTRNDERRNAVDDHGVGVA